MSKSPRNKNSGLESILIVAVAPAIIALDLLIAMRTPPDVRSGWVWLGFLAGFAATLLIGVYGLVKWIWPERIGGWSPLLELTLLQTAAMIPTLFLVFKLAKLAK